MVRVPLVVGALSLAVFFGACSSDSEEDSSDTESETKATATAKASTGGAGDATVGRTLATQNGCAGCHSTDGSVLVGPSWKGLAGTEVELADGKKVVADDAYLTESMKTPNAKVHKGFQPNLMPQLPLTDGDIANLIAYIKTLK
jgi:cytochrome c oxidase subunit 2